MKERWDIFCDVVDNYGDIGVCWRLARQLAAEYPLSVRLWVNHLDTARKLIPGLAISPCDDTGQATHQKYAHTKQYIENVEICHWDNDFSFTDASFSKECLGDVVIEAFACELPHAYVTAMTNAFKPPVWINMEYLSAEHWVAEYHGQHSIQPATGLKKYFFFPGFSENTGGLIREQNLITERDAYLQSAAAQNKFWRGLGLEAEASKATYKLSLFCYPQAPALDLLDSLVHGDEPCLCVVTQGTLDNEIRAFFCNGHSLSATYLKGNLSLKVIPFLSQPEYDRLLWSCDINFVRGEDSWIRAIWSGKPLVWQPYLQEDEAHLVKLQAFLEAYCEGMQPTWESWQAMQYKWVNGQKDEADPLAVFHDALLNIEQLKQAARLRSEQLASGSDLAARLVSFCRNRV